MDALDEFRENIKNAAKKQVKVTNVWATVKEVDWDAKTMTATGIVDDLDYFDVLLGIGSIYTKPVQDSRCLIGVIENKEAATYMIWAEEIEQMVITDQTGFEWNLKDGELTMNGDNHEGIVIGPELKNQLDVMTARIDALYDAIQNAKTGANDGGKTYQSNMDTILTDVPQKEDFSNIQNDTIKHGG